MVRIFKWLHKWKFPRPGLRWLGPMDRKEQGHGPAEAEGSLAAPRTLKDIVKPPQNLLKSLRRLGAATSAAMAGSLGL